MIPGRMLLLRARTQPLPAAGESGHGLLGSGDGEWLAVPAHPRMLLFPIPARAPAQAPVSTLGAIQLREPGRALRAAP
jgi:hypothetical protein